MAPRGFHAIRQAHGSQRKVAARMGIGFRTLQRIESGEMGDPIPEKYANMIRGFAK
jgi:transcriptional regulator with XRE-family HTH domain